MDLKTLGDKILRLADINSIEMRLAWKERG